MEIRVGIVSGDQLSFTLKGSFRETVSKKVISGDVVVTRIESSQVELNTDQGLFKLPLPITLQPVNADSASFVLWDVCIGKAFHWQRTEDQEFKGNLQLILGQEGITAVNQIDIEDYLKSVISSEMSATSSINLLKAHAVISRSWLLAQISKTERLAVEKSYYSCHKTEDYCIRWYDREEHIDYDVCADDHCQRYQGITSTTSPAVNDAVETTRGEVLMYYGEICDTRFSKCCGGVTELFENVWEPKVHPYLRSFADADPGSLTPIPDLRTEAGAESWIRGSFDSYCNCNDHKIISQVLNSYDRETPDFYRWKVVLRQDELQHLLKEKAGLELGEIHDLIPIERGASGRLIQLKIVGSKGAFTIGKELEIRRVLSKSHLYSSAFIVEKGPVHNGIVSGFSLIGAGWGHGVGLCQIGAAVMGAKGIEYRKILSHYFRGAELQKIW